MDQLERHRLAADREIGDGALRLRAPQGTWPNLDLTEAVSLLAGLFHGWQSGTLKVTSGLHQYAVLSNRTEAAHAPFS